MGRSHPLAILPSSGNSQLSLILHLPTLPPPRIKQYGGGEGTPPQPKNVDSQRMSTFVPPGQNLLNASCKVPLF